MALGTFTITQKVAAQGPVQFVRATVVGDNAYVTGGSTGLLAALRAALGNSQVKILSARDDYAAVATRATHVVYDPATDRLISRTTSTGAEFTTPDQSGTIHTLLITCY